MISIKSRILRSSALFCYINKKWDKIQQLLPRSEPDWLQNLDSIALEIEPIISNISFFNYKVSKQNGFLTDHGPEHLIVVLDRASKIINYPDIEHPNSEINCFEIYILIYSILIHDVGNLLGRKDHEKKIRQVICKLHTYTDINRTITNLAIQIASTHGNTGEKEDTISSTLGISYDFAEGLTFRPQLIAAILRLSDEFSDESSRADTFALYNKTSIPKSSEVYHRYAKSLSTPHFMWKTNTIQLEYYLYKDDIVNKCGKDGRMVYLIDEIYKRFVKSFVETVYCMDYIQDYLPCKFRILKGKIVCLNACNSPEPIKNIVLHLQRQGYPLYLNSVELKDPNGMPLPAGTELEHDFK